MKTRYPLVGVAFLVGFSLLMGGCGRFFDLDGSLFPDPDLELAIREAIGKPTGKIRLADLVALESLQAPNRGITSLEGLQFCTDLTSLDVGSEWMPDRYVNSNDIVDLTPLAGLTNLTHLSLSGNRIVDLMPLAGLTNLELLYLSENQITEITSLAKLTKLYALTLWANRITDLAPLATLVQLNSLSLSINRISDLTPLAGLTSLSYLALEHNQITDLTPLAGLPTLWRLKVRENLLDLKPGSPAMLIIEDFLNRGVDVEYEPQK